MFARPLPRGPRGAIIVEISKASSLAERRAGESLPREPAISLPSPRASPAN